MNYIYIRFIFEVSEAIFCTNFWKRVHNSKEIVNIQDLFVLTVGNVDMTTYPLTKYYYIIEKVYFIYRLFVLFISTFQFLLFLYTASWRYKRDHPHASIYIYIYILFNIMFWILLTRWRNIRLFYNRFVLRYIKDPDLNLFQHKLMTEVDELVRKCSVSQWVRGNWSVGRWSVVLTKLV